MPGTVAPVPSGESPDGTGESPVLPRNEFSDRLLIRGPFSETVAVMLTAMTPTSRSLVSPRFVQFQICRLVVGELGFSLIRFGFAVLRYA